MVLLNDITGMYRAQLAERRLMLERSHQQDEKIESLNRLAQSLAHQVRNPVSTMGGFAKRIEGLLASHGVASSYPSIILEQAKRLESIVQGVVRLGSLRITCIAKLETSRILDMTLSRTSERAESLGKRLIPVLKVTNPTFEADETLLIQALAELLDNCVDFSESVDVVVDILVESIDNKTRISVIDQGPGIPQDILPFVFEPFFTSKSLGSGLGLTVARQIVLDHGGTIKAGPGPNATGTVVEILLPGDEADSQSSNRKDRDGPKGQ